MDDVTPKIPVIIGCLVALSPAFAQEGKPVGPTKLVLSVASDPPAEQCRRIGASHALFAMASLHRTFHDDFDEHPLSRGKWVPHYAGGAAWPDARYWGGAGSDFKRKTSWNGEQQIYVDPRYAGQGATPLGLDPFRVRDGVLSIVATRTPPNLKPALFDKRSLKPPNAYRNRVPLALSGTLALTNVIASLVSGSPHRWFGSSTALCPASPAAI